MPPRFLPPHGAQSQPADLVAAQWAEVRLEIGGGMIYEHMEGQPNSLLHVSERYIKYYKIVFNMYESMAGQI